MSDEYKEYEERADALIANFKTTIDNLRVYEHWKIEVTLRENPLPKSKWFGKHFFAQKEALDAGVNMLINELEYQIKIRQELVNKLRNGPTEKEF